MIGAANISKLGSIFAISLLSLGIVSLNYLQNSILQPTERNVPIEQIPLQLSDWTGEDLKELGVRSAQILQLDHYIRRLYTNSNGDQVFLYIGYWSKQTGEYQAAKHSPATCLSANGWRVSNKTVEQISLPSKATDAPMRLRTLVGEFQQSRSLFYYWFFSGEKEYWDEWQALFHLALQTFFHGRSDGGIVEISTKLAGAHEQTPTREMAQETINDFLSVLYPELDRLLHQTA